MNELIEFLKYIALGLIQGITEPLPVSSSGHMIILDSIFGRVLTTGAMNNFQIIVNFASLIAIILFYRDLIKKLIIGSWNYIFHGVKEDKHHFIYVLLIIIATIPAGIAGIIIKSYNLDIYYTNILIVGICLFITGNLLLFIHHNADKANKQEITLKVGIIMGFAQVLGILPGISRSGVTASFAVNNKVNLEKALRFSFMMYIPASLGAAVLGLYDILKTSEVASGSGSLIGYIGAFVASLIGTYFAINLFFKLVKNKNLKYFGYYCIGISIIVLTLIVTGVFKW